jgi:predicted nucleotidyltransferase
MKSVWRKMMTKAEVVKSICEKYNIALCYLFGSNAEKVCSSLNKAASEPITVNNDPLTDLDIGIVMQERLPGADKRYQLYAEIYNELTDIFNPLIVDLSFLEENHSVFQVEALKGYCLYAVNEKFKDVYEEMILRRAADFKPVLDLFLAEALEEAIENAK